MTSLAERQHAGQESGMKVKLKVNRLITTLIETDEGVAV